MLLFVYGTLRRGFKNHGRYLAGRTTFAGRAVLRGAVLVHLPEGYPAALGTGEAEDLVHGELYRLPDDAAHARSIVAGLDALEDYLGPGDPRNLYERAERAVEAGGGTRPVALVYLHARPQEALERGILVPGGDWTAFVRREASGAWS
ncbi:gamma-glutamylcyclotransferase family protein [Limnochorda pilosa]|uniref:gamma-glutamylcyclotransferase family protein n=1 Tax=Limnochorda pilosa TaxID=1555112 RepID=UPI000829B5CC|nr:gamma-glutamylcyclotransferase family protein [Limnochorda pilosa]